LLYRTTHEAFTAAFRAARAPLYGQNWPNPDHKELGGRTGYGWWTSPDKAEVIAEGLRLTGYEVVLIPGYSVGVVILDPID
jgi:hypothetical protein